MHQSGSRASDPPKRRGRRSGETYDDGVEDVEVEEIEVEQPEKKNEKEREREPEADPLTDWLEEDAEAESEYWIEDNPEDSAGPETVFHAITKRSKDKACFEWALRGMGTDGPNPEHFWLWLMGLGSEPAWMAPLAVEIEQELQRMTLAIAPLIRSPANNFGDIKGAKKARESKAFVTRAMEILAGQCGFTIVADADAAGWIVCQYKTKNGAAFPEHFWLEVPASDGSMIVVQTVSGLPVVEIGGADLRWHSDTSAEGRDAEVEHYDTVRIPVQALLPKQVAVLRAGMNAERRRKKPRGK